MSELAGSPQRCWHIWRGDSVQCLTIMPIHQNNSRMASIASGNFSNALNKRKIFCFFDCFIFTAATPSPKRKIWIYDDHWRNGDDPIEPTMNLHWSFQTIGNIFIFAKKGKIPRSGRVFSYIPLLTFYFQQVRHRTKYTMPWQLPADSSKSNRYSTAHTDFPHFITHHIKQ
jgi:hypothetical protein